MQTIVHISASSAPLPDQAFHALLNLHPEGGMKARSWGSGEVTITSWYLERPISDTIAQQAIKYLIATGYLSNDNLQWRAQKPGIRIWLKRKYSRTDLNNSELLAFNGLKYAPDLGWRTKPEGLIVLPVARLRKIASTNAETLYTERPGWTVVSNRVRQVVEQSDMRHVIFRPTVLVHGNGRPDDPPASWNEVGDPWWEMSSDYTLPPLSPTVQIVAQDGRPFIGYEKQNLELREGLHQIPELHYLRSDIERTEPFDLALSYEHIGKPPHQQMKIASARLYQLFRAHSIKASWVPVRIDES